MLWGFCLTVHNQKKRTNKEYNQVREVARKKWAFIASQKNEAEV
jgi:aminopeptidase-like protein